MLNLGNFLEDCLALNNDNASDFPSESFRSTPSVPPPLSLQPPSPVLRGTRRRSRCVARGFPLSTRASKSSVNPKTHACTISQSINSTMIRLLGAVLSPKNPLFHSVLTNWGIQTLKKKPVPTYGGIQCVHPVCLSRLYSTPQHPEPAQSTSNQRRVFTNTASKSGEST